MTIGEARRGRILELLRTREAATVEDLAELLGVSRMTVHRDLDRLADLKLVRRIRGGATLQPSVVFESDAGYRARQHVPEKRALAGRISELIEPGMALFLDDSTTTSAVLSFLPERLPLTVITNGLSVMNALARQEGIALISLGGRYDPISDAFFGIVCESSAARLRADIGIFSTAAVHGASAYLRDQDVARAKLAMMAASDRNVIAFDQSKFGKSALNLFTPLTTFDHVFVPDSTDPRLVAELKKAQVRVETVPVEGAASQTSSVLKERF